MTRFNAENQHILLRQIRDIPSLPEVVNEIIRLLGQANTPASQIAELVAYDPGLTSKVLRMVNSAAYGLQRQISSIQHGIMILGFNTVRGLVLSASIFKLFDDHESTRHGLNYKAFWSHSMATGIGARLIGQQLKLPQMEDAFSAGMLHDIGKMVLNAYFRQDYLEVIQTADHRKLAYHGQAFLLTEQEILGTDHTRIGAFLANKWKLPLTLAEAIQFHHAPDQAESAQSIVYVIALANELSRLMLDKEGQLAKSYTIRVQEPLMEYFGLEQSQIDTLYGLIYEELQQAGDLFSAIASPQSDSATTAPS